uniref:Uncharacterized protein n=1 Tax=Rhizophora mucronata TaxID=61149 RepID=A0A2P2N7J3_RHIMU
MIAKNDDVVSRWCSSITKFRLGGSEPRPRGDDAQGVTDKMVSILVALPRLASDLHRLCAHLYRLFFVIIFNFLAFTAFLFNILGL